MEEKHYAEMHYAREAIWSKLYAAKHDRKAIWRDITSTMDGKFFEG